MEYELQQVLKGLALNRIPGWNFPGNFLEVSFDEVGADHATLSVDPGPHCTDSAGHMALGPLCVLADIGMGAVMRTEVGLGTRMATVAMSLQFTGVPAAGRIESHGRLDGFVAGALGRQGLMRTQLRAGGQLVAAGSGTFLALGNRAATAPLPLRRRGEDTGATALAPADLAAEELAVFDRARTCLAEGEGTFIERFWDLRARRTTGGAQIDFANGLHVGNRVGHTQGGITFALAAATGAGALDAHWRLVGISAWYLSPGTGPRLRAEATIVHQGGLTAVVRTRVSDGEGRAVLEAITHHARGD